MIQDKDKRLPEAYERMIERSAHLLEGVRETASSFEHALHQASNKAIQLGELRAEEAAQVARYIEHDVQDMAHHFVEQECDFTDWLKLDILLIEKRLLKHITSLLEPGIRSWINFYGQSRGARQGIVCS